MGPLGVGSWHDWKVDHAVALLGCVWYNISRSSTDNSNFERYRNLIVKRFPGKQWTSKFIKPAETRWMVVFEAAGILFERWEEVQWLYCDWAPTHILSTMFKRCWSQASFMLQDAFLKVQVMFAARLGEVVLNWAYRWLRGKGGYFVKRGDQRERLPPGMRLAELADFSLEFLRRLEEVRADPETYLGDVVALARSTLDADVLKCFMTNFSKDEGFFATASSRWTKWTERHQHLPLSISRIACSSFHVGEWAGKPASEHAVGQEYARAILNVVWPDQYSQRCRSDRERSYRELLHKDLAGAITIKQKDELTFNLFSLLDKNATLRGELVRYAESAWGGKEVVHNDPRGASLFQPLWEFGGLYEMACHRFYFVPIHQQLVESFFSKYDTCGRSFDFSEMDVVRSGQYRSAESRHIFKSGATAKQIRAAGKGVLKNARSERNRSYAEVPAARHQRKRVLEDAGAVLKALEPLRRKQRSLGASEQ